MTIINRYLPKYSVISKKDKNWKKSQITICPGISVSYSFYVLFMTFH